MNRRIKNTQRNIVSGILFKFVSLFLPFVLRTVMLYSMGSEYTGLNSLFVSVLRVLSLTELGLQNVIVFCLYKPIAEGDEDTICGIISFYRKVYFIIGLIILGIGSLLGPFISFFIQGSWPKDINIYIIYMVYLINTACSYMMFAYKGTLLNAHQRVDIVNIVTMSVYLCQYIIQIIVLILYRNYYIYIIVTPMATILINIIQSVITDKMYPQYKKNKAIEDSSLIAIKDGVKGSVLVHITDATRNSFDNIMISSLIGLTAVTIYNNYFYVVSSFYAMMLSISIGMTASVGDSIARESIEHNYINLRKFTYMYSFISSILTACILCLYQDFMKIWVGETFMLPFSNAVIFTIYFYILNIKSVRDMYFAGTGLWWQARNSYILESVFNIVLNYVFVFIWGIVGACIASIVTMVLFNYFMRTHILFKLYFVRSPFEYNSEQLKYLIYTGVICFLSYIVSQSIYVSDRPISIILKGGGTVLISTTLTWMMYRGSRFYDDAIKYMGIDCGRLKNK